MKIEISLEAAAVLLRCLGYGAAAISHAEEKSGEAAVIIDNIQLIRAQICHKIAGKIITSAANGHSTLE